MAHALTRHTDDECVPQLLLTPEQGARAIRVSRTVMFQLMREGEVASVRIGRSRRVPMAALEEYVARLRQATVPPA